VDHDTELEGNGVANHLNQEVDIGAEENASLVAQNPTVVRMRIPHDMEHNTDRRGQFTSDGV